MDITYACRKLAGGLWKERFGLVLKLRLLDTCLARSLMFAGTGIFAEELIVSTVDLLAVVLRYFVLLRNKKASGRLQRQDAGGTMDASLNNG